MSNKKQKLVTVDAQGVSFGNSWFSHEAITGYSAEQFNSGDCKITGRQYMAWLNSPDKDSTQSELAALREELATEKRNEHNSEVAYQAAIEKQNELRDRKNSIVDLQQRLTAAEQRNAGLVELLRETLPALALGASAFKSVKPVQMKVKAVLKPTESGASE